MLSCLQKSRGVLLQQQVGKRPFLPLPWSTYSQPWPRPTRERWDLTQQACSPFSGYFELLFALVSWQDPGKMQLLFSLVGALFQRIALAVFPPTYAMNQPLRIHHLFQDKQEESMEQIRIGLFFLTTFIAEVWEKKGSSSET